MDFDHAATPATPAPRASFPSDADARAAVRADYRVLTEAERGQIVALKAATAAFIGLCREIGGSREMALAITNAEQAAMWAVKHVTA
ncbi:hypothetical protein [Amaricoccus sp.]|uniref:Acb2/Tad1 domain-containing protein n=1 Tax=Amaricoccus sp. TaxID=1872485 RepID=UPI001B765309|nr:hypothetical protein [Amaricoccus sp.]MBP7001707.1 hypothetical protein [Amaricoccus sp.]